MKTMIAALALLTLAAGPVFAQSYEPPRPDGYYGPNGPAFTVERPIGNVWGHWLTRPESCAIAPRTGLLSCQ
jgi:hypothetical protein